MVNRPFRCCRKSKEVGSLVCLEAVEFAEAESPGAAVDSVSASVDRSAEMAATDAFGPEEGHVVWLLEMVRNRFLLFALPD